MVRMSNYSTIPDLDEEEQSLLVLVFISTPGFLANGTFPKVDREELAKAANYSTAASANTAWYAVRKKLTALAKTSKPNATGPKIINAATAFLPSESTITRTTSSVKKRTRNTASLDQSEDGSESEHTDAAKNTKSRKISAKVASTDPATPSVHTAPRTTRSVTARSSSFIKTETPVRSTLESAPKLNDTQVEEEDMTGKSTYARHTRGTSMAFGFPGELNILYDDPKEQEDDFNEDFGDFDSGD